MMAQQRKRCSYDLSFKLKAIKSAENTSKEAAARQFGVDARRIRKWRGQKTIKRRPRFNAGSKNSVNKQTPGRLIKEIR